MHAFTYSTLPPVLGQITHWCRHCVGRCFRDRDLWPRHDFSGFKRMLMPLDSYSGHALCGISYLSQYPLLKGRDGLILLLGLFSPDSVSNSRLTSVGKILRIVALYHNLCRPTELCRPVLETYPCGTIVRYTCTRHVHPYMHMHVHKSTRMCACMHSTYTITHRPITDKQQVKHTYIHAYSNSWNNIHNTHLHK